MKNAPWPTLRAVLWTAIALIGFSEGRLIANDGPPSATTHTAATPSSDFGLDTYRALGAEMAHDSHLPDLGWDQQKIAAFVAGVEGAFAGRGETADPQLPALRDQLNQTLATMEVQRRHAELITPEGMKRFLRTLRKNANLRETDSGLCYRVLKPGSGIHPRSQDSVIVSFDCRTADDMSLVPSVRADHLKVTVADLLPGLGEAVQMMTEDGELLAVLTPDLSFRQGPWPDGIDRGLPLAFVIKLHQVIAGEGTSSR